MLLRHVYQPCPSINISIFPEHFKLLRLGIYDDVCYEKFPVEIQWALCKVFCNLEDAVFIILVCAHLKIF
jgi:hypothetical protein